jgi:molecular chaperone HscB
MQQMAWRESLDEARDVEALDVLSAEVAGARKDVLQRCEQLIDGARDYAAAVAQVRALMFIERFAHDIDNRYEMMESRLG